MIDGEQAHERGRPQLLVEQHEGGEVGERRVERGVAVREVAVARPYQARSAASSQPRNVYRPAYGCSSRQAHRGDAAYHVAKGHVASGMSIAAPGAGVAVTSGRCSGRSGAGSGGWVQDESRTARETNDERAARGTIAERITRITRPRRPWPRASSYLNTENTGHPDHGAAALVLARLPRATRQPAPLPHERRHCQESTLVAALPTGARR